MKFDEFDISITHIINTEYEFPNDSYKGRREQTFIVLEGFLNNEDIHISVTKNIVLASDNGEEICNSTIERHDYYRCIYDEIPQEPFKPNILVPTIKEFISNNKPEFPWIEKFEEYL